MVFVGTSPFETEDEKLITATRISCGNCKSVHTSAAEVKACYTADRGINGKTEVQHYADQTIAHVADDDQVTVIAQTCHVDTNAATPKQLAFLARLIDEREYGIEDHEIQRTIELGRRAVSTLIDALVQAPKKRTAQSQALELVDGIYEKDDVVFKVYHTVHGANQQVAKQLVQDAEGTWSFEYKGKFPLRSLTLADKMTAERAKDFGLVYGICIRCTRTLTREESLHVGYGGTCAGIEGWWYPSKKDLKALATGGAIEVICGGGAK